MQRTFDVQAVREQFPALGRTYRGRAVVYFDGPGGSQVARQAIEAISGYMERGGANLHGVFPTSTETEEILADTRGVAADFLGAAPEEIAFGANMTTLTFALSRALAEQWDESSEIVVTELDHRANVDPWLIAATEKGARVRWIGVDSDTLTFDEEDLARNINERTRLVAIGLASNAVGAAHTHRPGRDRGRHHHLFGLQVLRSARRRDSSEARPLRKVGRLQARPGAGSHPGQAGDRHPEPRGDRRSEGRPRLHRLPGRGHLTAGEAHERHGGHRRARSRPGGEVSCEAREPASRRALCRPGERAQDPDHRVSSPGTYHGGGLRADAGARVLYRCRRLLCLDASREARH